MTYFCEKCNYTTERKFDWEKHITTSKHKNKCKKVYFCEKCNKTLNSKSNFYLHKKKCQNINENLIEELSENNFHEKVSSSEENLRTQLKKAKEELQNEKLKREFENLKIKHECDQKEIERLNKLLNQSNKTTEKALKITDKTISAIKYANENFKNAPALTPINNFNLLDYDLSNEDGKKLLLETLLYHYKTNSVHTIFGNHIISQYKKENVTEQSMHATDTSRLNYIIRISKDEKPVQWFTDKNGVIISDVIIEKLIDHYVDLLKWYQKKLTDEMSKDPGRPQPYIQQKVENILNMLMDVDNGQLVKNTNKYIAPFFNLDK